MAGKKSIFQKLVNLWNPRTTREEEVRGTLSDIETANKWNAKRGEYAAGITAMTSGIINDVRNSINSIVEGLTSIPINAVKLANNFTLGAITKIGTQAVGKLIHAPVKLLFSGMLITAAEAVEKTDIPFRITGHIYNKTNKALDGILTKSKNSLLK